MLALTAPIDSHRSPHWVYAQLTAPIIATYSGARNVALPIGTAFQAHIRSTHLDTFSRQADLTLDRLTLVLPNGYVLPLPGQLAAQSGPGSATHNFNAAREVELSALPLGGATLGYVIGHSNAGASTYPSSAYTTGFPPPPPSFNSARNGFMGALVGGLAGGAAAAILYFSDHSLYVYTGSSLLTRLRSELQVPAAQAADAARRARAISPAPSWHEGPAYENERRYHGWPPVRP